MIDLGFFVRAESLISFLNDLGVLIILTALNVWMWAGSENSPKYGKSQGHVPPWVLSNNLCLQHSKMRLHTSVNLTTSFVLE